MNHHEELTEAQSEQERKLCNGLFVLTVSHYCLLRPVWIKKANTAMAKAADVQRAP